MRVQVPMLLASMLLASVAQAQPAAAPPASGPPAPAPPYGPNITTDQAQAAMTAAEAEARSHGWRMAIAVVEPSGDLVMFKKLQDTQYGSVDLAMGKARTAARFRRPSKALQDALKAGNLAVLAQPGGVPIEGGVPILAGGRIIGAIGASGGSSDQDAQVSMAGAAVVR